MATIDTYRELVCTEFMRRAEKEGVLEVARRTKKIEHVPEHRHVDRFAGYMSRKPIPAYDKVTYTVVYRYNGVEFMEGKVPYELAEAYFKERGVYELVGLPTQIECIGCAYIAHKGGRKIAYWRGALLGEVENPICAAGCLLDGERVFLRDGEVIEGVKNPSDIIRAGEKDKYITIYPSSFRTNDDGEVIFVPRFCVMEREEAIDFYESHSFRHKAAALRAEMRAEEEKLLQQNNELSELVMSSSGLLIPVIFHNGGCDGDEAVIYYADKRHGRYNKSSRVCQYLYGIQEKGWRGYAERGMLINIPVAKRSMRNGVLHLYVPKSAMGKIIGTKGANISRTKEALRKKGLDGLKDIRLHPIAAE